MKSKKAVLDLINAWVDYVLLIMLIVGFVFSVSLGSAFMSYIVIFLCGIFIGRVLYINRKALPFKYYLISFVFLIGYLFGTNFSFGNRTVIVIIFILSTMLSYYIHDKKYIKS
jgi:uncharacterized membrane protein